MQWHNLTELGVFNQWAPLWIFSRKSKMWWKPLEKKNMISRLKQIDFKICCNKMESRWKIKWVKTENICHLFSSTSCWEKPLEIITLKFDYCWLSSHLFRFSWIYTVFLWGEVIFQLCITLTTLSGSDFFLKKQMQQKWSLGVPTKRLNNQNMALNHKNLNLYVI